MLFKMSNEKKTKDCCGPQTDCCGPQREETAETEKLLIEFLYLDLSVCDRCQGADHSLDLALENVAGVLTLTGVEVDVNKIEISTLALAETHRFVSSPTIRINGRDIQFDVVEDRCASSGDLCGDEVDCRLWQYKGKQYTEPPRAMIVEAILRAVYGGKPTVGSDVDYTVPENLMRFFEGKELQNKS